MKFLGKYKIVTGITTEYKINPENPKYFAKYVNDNIMCLGNTEEMAIDNLKNTYEEYKRKNKLCSFLSEQVLDSHVSTEKFEKYFYNSVSIEFFELIGEDPYCQVDDETTVEDFELSNEQIKLLNSTYRLNIKIEDLMVDIFEQIQKNRA